MSKIGIFVNNPNFSQKSKFSSIICDKNTKFHQQSEFSSTIKNFRQKSWFSSKNCCQNNFKFCLCHLELRWRRSIRHMHIPQNPYTDQHPNSCYCWWYRQTIFDLLNLTAIIFYEKVYKQNFLLKKLFKNYNFSKTKKFFLLENVIGNFVWDFQNLLFKKFQNHDNFSVILETFNGYALISIEKLSTNWNFDKSRPCLEAFFCLADITVRRCKRTRAPVWTRSITRTHIFAITVTTETISMAIKIFLVTWQIATFQFPVANGVACLLHF